VRGDLKIRACDHQAEVSEATGTIAAATDPRYGLRLWDNVYVAPAAQILKPCA
jgi:hypothetical protein